jgi:hypothetical protein
VAGLGLGGARTAVERLYPHPPISVLTCRRPILHPSAASRSRNIREPAKGNSRLSGFHPTLVLKASQTCGRLSQPSEFSPQAPRKLGGGPSSLKAGAVFHSEAGEPLAAKPPRSGAMIHACSGQVLPSVLLFASRSRLQRISSASGVSGWHL